MKIVGAKKDNDHYFFINEETEMVKVTKFNSKEVEKHYGKDVANDFTARVQLPVDVIKRLELKNKIYKIKKKHEN